MVPLDRSALAIKWIKSSSLMGLCRNPMAPARMAFSSIPSFFVGGNENIRQTIVPSRPESKRLA